MVRQVDKYRMNYDEFDSLLKRLINKVKFANQVWNFDVVVSICNGGLRIGGPLSRALNLPHQSVQITRYHGPQIIRNINYTQSAFKQPLVVDDLTDNGTTLNLFTKHFGKATFAVLLHNKEVQPEPEFYAAYKPQTWIVFPWEENNV